MADQDVLNYPDLLGAVTGGTRLNLDVVQCALAVRPAQVPAGAFFEMVLLVQNASDGDVDVVAEPVLPERDAARQKSRFLTRNDRLRIGLRPAEVGYLTLPVSTSAKTAPASSYEVGLKVTIKRIGKHHARVRLPDGGGVFLMEELSRDVQAQLGALRGLAFSAEAPGRKNFVQARLEILPPALSTLKELKPNWISLWTVQDYLDDATIAARVASEVAAVEPHLTRDVLFMPLLKATQSRFQAAGYPLHPPEAILIAKLLTLLLEQGAAGSMPGPGQPALPRWYSRMCHLLLQEPGLAAQPEGLITQLVYPALVHDAVHQGFAMVATVTGESFGTPAELAAYADMVSGAVAEGQPLDLAHVYLPLVLGGLIINARLTLPREQIRETVSVLVRALDLRRAERSPENVFVFDLADRLIERALETA